MNPFRLIFRRRRIYSDLSEELRQHLEEKTEQLMRLDGLSRQEAEQAARRAFGNRTVIEERSRASWQWPAIENLLRDIAFSARLLRRSPGFTFVAILTLTLGVGANTAVFSLLNGLLLRPLPVPDAQRLVLLKLHPGPIAYSFCTPLFRALEARHDIFHHAFATNSHEFQFRGKNGNEQVDGAMVSGQFFDAMETAPQLGRALTPGDDRKGAAGYGVVISDSFWKVHFDRDPNVLGRRLMLDGVAFTVVGVMPPGFIGADATHRPRLYIPLSAEPLVDGPYAMLDQSYQSWWLRVGARLKPGVSLAQANAALAAASPAIMREVITDPKWSFFKADRESLGVSAESGAAGFSNLRTEYRSPLLMTFALCVLVLLLACLNLASLLLARSASREREIATRLAIGASRRRLIQQLMIDSLLLAVLGTGAGLALAPLASRLLVNMLTHGSQTLYLDASIDWRVLLFAAGAAVLSTMLVGLLPAFQATAGDLVQHMKDGGRGSTKSEHRRLLPKALLTLEVALTMVLVTGAGLLGASLFRLYHSGQGFDAHGLVEVNIDPDRQPLEGPAVIRLYRDIAERISALPGVRAVGYASVPPLSGSSMMSSEHAPGGGDRDVYTNTIGPGYFDAMRTAILEGRDFNTRDLPDQGGRVIINHAAAKMFFPSGDALGKTLAGSIPGKPERIETIVGIVEDTKYSTLKEPAPPTVYYPISADGHNKKPSFTAMVRFSGPIAPLAAAIRGILTSVSPDIPEPSFHTMDKEVDDSIAAERVMALLSIFFAVSALLVTGIGLYGVLAYSTARRTSEIGIRMALGAAPSQVIGLIFRENAWTAGAGCVAGLIAAILASRAVASFLYGTSARDPWILSASLAILCLIAAIASLVPAVRAASIDPMQALRSE
ncbi:putative permease [Silvibacterium bohemicum]|uniref:Putative permease n=1 Tax=Silvibacterium bohemicum TaxID=1577686 RepID=A0A841K349_9BACT|nr:ABC transporter permease [Silvibacterium bohemicum]MBB6145581.1 putative permease [Silvibacterium bohemicum]